MRELISTSKDKKKTKKEEEKKQKKKKGAGGESIIEISPQIPPSEEKATTYIELLVTVLGMSLVRSHGVFVFFLSR